MNQYLAAPADPAAPLLSHDPLSGEVVAVVEDGGHITAWLPPRTCGRHCGGGSWRARPYHRPLGLRRADS
jgi:hypothetical protein